jgi:hypothetical protein
MLYANWFLRLVRTNIMLKNSQKQIFAKNLTF